MKLSQIRRRIELCMREIILRYIQVSNNENIINLINNKNFINLIRWKVYTKTGDKTSKSLGKGK
jgi:hypothetical protein